MRESAPIMDLDLREAARLLNVSEDTVYGWVREGVLPAHKVHQEYRFNRVEIQEWAVSRRHPVSPELFATNGSAEPLPALHGALERGGICYQMEGDRRNAVLGEVSRLPQIPETVDRARLKELLVTREALASTAIGDGIAIPHPRDPLVFQVTDPYVFICFLKNPVDFKALDGQPVRVLFVLLSPSVRFHLQMLSKIAFALHDKPFKKLIKTASPPEEILERVKFLDSRAPC